ncbi:MAG: septal ring lytic transglycosylase RlpA family protein [Treponema sp.]|jgi:rare lipoprotein A|nr:septal ring lytic transglycosylase RlpA family protein [Treponema sp.]
MKRISIFVSFLVMFFLALASIPAQSQLSTGLNFRQEGIASWYGPGFAGRPTASGEIFDPSQLTAAHPSLPFGTVLTVTNTFNNRQVRVRINDRGPFVAARIIDLSQAAAEALDMLITGTAHVIIDTAANPLMHQMPAPVPIPAPAPTVIYIPPVIQNPQPVIDYYPPPAPSYSPPLPPAIIIGGMPPLGTGKYYRLQVGVYRVPRNAVEAFEKLKSAGLNPRYEPLNDMYRVVLAGLRPEELQNVAEKLGSAGFGEVIIREER